MSRLAVAHASFAWIPKLVSLREQKADPLKVSVSRGGPELIERYAEEWNDLCRRARPEIAFLLPQLVLETLAAFDPQGSLLLLTAHRRNELVAVLPLLEKSLGVGRVRLQRIQSAGGAPLPRFDAVYADAPPAAIAKAFWRALRDYDRWSVLEFNDAPTEGVVRLILDAAARDGLNTRLLPLGESPYIDVPPSPENIEELISQQSRRIRRPLRKGLQRLRERGKLRFLSIAGAGPDGDIADWVEKTSELEHQGWKGRAGTSILSNESSRRYYTSLARNPEIRQYLHCYALLLNDRPVAAQIGLRVGGTYFDLKNAFDEHYRDCSPGHLLILHQLADIARRGGTVFDLSGRAEPHKTFWTDKSRPFARMFIFRPGIQGYLARLAILEAIERARRLLKGRPWAREAMRLARRARARSKSVDR